MSARSWPIGIVVALSAVVVVNAIMVAIAVSNPSVPATQDHWSESLAWDEELALREQSAALGWTVVALRRGPSGALELKVVDREGAPVVGLRGQLALRRADDRHLDVQLELTEVAPGHYRSSVSAPAKGLVRAELDLHDSAERRFRFAWTVDLAVIDLAGDRV